MKFNRKCVNIMCRVIGLFFVVPLLTSCDGESAYSRLLTQEYPALYEQVYERNSDSLLTFTEHPDEFIRAQAWRALISTPVEDMDDFITKVQYSNTEEGWMALSAKELDDAQLQRLHNLWKERTSLRKGISRVLGQQGNQASLDVLIQNFDEIIDRNHEFESALAIGRLMIDHEISSGTKRSILRYAAVIEEPELYRAYFYGLYRSNAAVEDEEILKAIWDGYVWVESPQIQQYILRIAFNSDPEGTLEKLPMTDISAMNVQLAIELAQQLGKVNWNDKSEEIFNKLLDHKNPVVNEVTLSQIENHPEKNTEFDDVIIEKIVDNEEKEASSRLAGILAMEDPASYTELANELASGNDYLLTKELNILQRAQEPEEFITTLSDYMASEDRMEVLFAAQALSDFWTELSASEKTNTLEKRVIELVFRLLDQQDRSITYVTVPFMNESGLIENDDFPRMEQYLADYKLPEDIEVYQVFGQFLKDRFELRSVELVDSLAEYGNVALNNTLKDQGWELPDVEGSPKTFRKPDWKRLGELGPNPVWVLETDKGNIEIEVNVLSAPATISGIDSLTQAGAYNDVAFHRVVPNFVIQGGDIETGDGFGGPDYVVPTEASTKHYYRGTVGIASAGTDTEGSQYFVMHDWAPHLNGQYTVIGEVTSGMDVVDKIVVGDKVRQAYWIPTEE